MITLAVAIVLRIAVLAVLVYGGIVVFEHANQDHHCVTEIRP